MRVLDLFSGIGGFSLGLEAAGHQTVAFCERDDFCQQILRKHWPDVPIHDDVKTLRGGDYEGRVDIVCGGYPCQGESIAGGRRGREDERWLGDEAVRIVQGCSPGWVIFENVANHIKESFDHIYSRLETLDFTIWPADIFSSAIGLPTLERHIWIIAQANGQRQQRLRKEQIPHKPKIQRQFPRGDKGDFQRWHLPEARVCGVGERVPRRLDRIKALGNAVPPEMTFIIGTAINIYEGLRE